MRALVTIVALAGCGGGDDTGAAPAREDVIADLTGDTTNGKALYDATCSVCHGAAGLGGTGPAINAGTGEDLLIESILYGGGGVMPAYEEDYSDQEIADITAYVLTFPAS
jgi:mono/diheme cytochrome c family protein